MKLTLTFDSIEEFEAFRAAAVAEAKAALEAAETPAKKPKAPAEAAEMPAETPEPAEGKTPAPKQKKAAKAEPAAEEAPLTVQAVRRTLADLNKSVGRNRAAEIVRELTGKERLTDTAPEDWPKIVARAEEELHAD